MLAYYGYTISPNQLETGEGFLICRNVPIARTGSQEYLGQEIGLTGPDAAKVVTVRRSPEEVFSDAAMASFEGKPATNDHPPGLIGPDDVAVYEKGHAANIRRGTGEWADYVLADLHIHDRALIDAVRNGKRKISCGYECEYAPNGDGTYSQLNIRGNHVAVVDRGRAGKRAAILDSGKMDEGQARRPERKAMKKKGLLFKLFGQAVKDKSPEEIEQLAMDAAEALAAEEEEGEGSPGDSQKSGKEGEGSQEGKQSAAKDEATLAALVEKLVDKRMAERQQAAGAKDDISQAIESLDRALAQEGNAPEDGIKEDGISAQEAQAIHGGAEAPVMDNALASSILKAMQPSVGAIKDEVQRKAVSDALIGLVTAKDGQGDIAAVIKASQSNARHMAGKKPAAMDTDAIQEMYDNLNPHRKKEGK